MPSLSANDLMWLRILDCLVASMGFCVLTGLCYYVFTTKGCGHRRLTLLVMIMFGGRSITLMLAAYAIFIHSHRHSVWASSLSAPCILLVAFYGFYTRHDIVRTLKRSEAIDAIWTWRINGAKQIALNTQYIAQHTLENVRKLG